MTKQPGAPGADPRLVLVVGALLAVLGAVAPLTAVYWPSRTAEPFVLTVAAQVLVAVALAWAGLRWWRATREATGADLAVAVLPVVLGAAAYALVSLVADAYGIRGSALPRLEHGVRHGVPLVVDVSYLAALAATGMVTLLAAGVLAVVVRSRVRSGGGISLEKP